MRVRVRRDDDRPTVQKQASVPWAVRAAATLPRGAQISNPLFGEDPEGTIAVLDPAATPDISLSELADIAKRAIGALVVWDDLQDGRDALRKHGFQPFTIVGFDDLLFGATYELPSTDWLRKDATPPADPTNKGDLAVAEDDPGHLQPEQGRRYRRVRTKDAVILEQIPLLSKSATVAKDEDGLEERFVLGIVLEPDEVDSQGDTISAEEIRSAAHRYMEEHANVGLQHQVFVNGKIKILESYIAPTDFSIGEERVKAGTWLMAFRILDDSIWKAVKEGLLDGLSIGGTGLRIGLS